MKSPCLHCGKSVAHVAYERPFCSVGCNADYARDGRARWTYGPDKNGGSRDLYLDGKLLIESALSSDALRFAEAANAATEALEKEMAEWKRRALAAEERLTWIRGGLKTLAEADDMTPMVKP